MRGFNWDNIKCFIATARAGSLTTAANELKVSPATLSRRLANLEHEIGRLLFARTPTGYVITSEGEKLLTKCLPIEDGFTALASAIDFGRTDSSGIVRVALSENIANLILIPRLSEFHARYPLIEMELRTGVQPIALHSREADIAIRVSMPETGAFKVRTVGSLSHGLYLSQTVNRSGAESDLGIIGWSEDNENLPIARAAMAHSYWRSPAVRVSSLLGHVAAARAGLGFAYIPCLVGDCFDDLVRIAGPEGYLRQDIYMVLHDDSIEMPKIRAVADFLVLCMNEAAPLFKGN